VGCRTFGYLGWHFTLYEPWPQGCLHTRSWTPCHNPPWSNFNFMWPCILESCEGEERTNYMQFRWSLLMLVIQHVSGIIMPIIRSTVQLWNHSHQVHTGSTSPPQVHSTWPVQNTVCGLSSFTVLLMMGIIMPETCWVTNINKLQLNCI
jgi:hypothetical protein